MIIASHSKNHSSNSGNHSNSLIDSLKETAITMVAATKLMDSGKSSNKFKLINSMLKSKERNDIQMGYLHH